MKQTITMIAAILLAIAAMASDVPFFLRQIEGPRDISAINENFRSLVNDNAAVYAKWMDPSLPPGKALCISRTTGAVAPCLGTVDNTGGCSCP